MPLLSVGTDGSLVLQDAYEGKQAIKDIGGYWDSLAKVWRLSFTIYNLDCVLENVPNLKMAPGMEEQVERQVQREEKLKRLAGLSKQDTPIRLKVPGLNASLYNYQRLGVMYAVTNGSGVLVADEMGLGKTIQAIATALILKSQGLAENALIVTPASLKYNWPIELEKFTDEHFVVIDGPEEQRIAQWLRDDVFFYVVNYEMLLEDLFGGRSFKKRKDESDAARRRREKHEAKAKKRERILGPVRRRVWDFIAVDEVQYVKNHGSKRTQNVKRLRSRFRMGLTGTPVDGRLEELHSIMGFIAPGLLGSKMRFFQRHIETDFFGRVTGYKRVHEIRERIEPCFIRRLKRDVLQDLPDKVYRNVMITLSPEEAKIYSDLADNGHEATEDAEAMVCIIRCKQFCNWPSMVDDTCGRSSKMDAFKDVVDEVVVQNGHKVLVFSQYARMVDVLVEVFDDMRLKYLRIDGDTPKKERADMQQIFADDASIDIMVGTEAMSTGLNFTPADYVINYDDSWSPSVMAQREDRSHRLGQRNVVTVVNFICRDTIEERIRGLIYAKNKISSEVLGDGTDEMVLKRMGVKETARLL